MKVHREMKRTEMGWLDYMSALCSKDVVIAIGDWFKWKQNPWTKVTCKRCLKKKGERVKEKMISVAGQNLYRVTYQMDYAETEFERLVVAKSEEEARSYLTDTVSCELVEFDVSMWIPEKYAVDQS